MTRIFTTGILIRNGKLLILKRKMDDDTYPGLWDCPGGHFEKGESAEECMIREAREESGLDVKILRPGPLLDYTDLYGRAISVPFMIRSDSGTVSLTEHSESKWIRPEEISNYRAVPDLLLALEAFGLPGAKSGPKIGGKKAPGGSHNRRGKRIHSLSL
ncbi:MAG: NUDIX hydrolase [Thaumarchaeota archaeon]|nr:NUDIX hydrolase [Nitrososphaerota archaeon]